MPKYMNCYWGQSRIFKRARFKVMPEGADVGSGGGGGGAAAPSAGSEDNPGDDTKQPTYEELVTQLARERAETQKQRNLKDTASKEAAEYKKQLRAKLTAEEQEQIAKKEADEAKDARIAELEAREKVRDYTELLMDKDIGMAKKEAKELSEMLVKGDFEKSLEILGKHIKTIKDEAYQQAMSDRPPINAGNGASDKNAVANEKAIASAKRTGAANEDILKHYRR